MNLREKLVLKNTKLQGLKIKCAKSKREKCRKCLDGGSRRRSNIQEVLGSELLYSICSEMFVERANFKGIMMAKHRSLFAGFGSFSAQHYFTHEYEFGPY